MGCKNSTGHKKKQTQKPNEPNPAEATEKKDKPIFAQKSCYFLRFLSLKFAFRHRQSWRCELQYC